MYDAMWQAVVNSIMTIKIFLANNSTTTAFTSVIHSARGDTLLRDILVLSIHVRTTLDGRSLAAR